MIIDCFPFFNEFTQLYLRMKIMPQVGRIILVESTTTQSGLPKPLYWNEQKDKLKWDVDFSKIIHVIVEDAPKDGRTWAAENFQRNAIKRGLDLIKPHDNDTILISDADEIPRLHCRNCYYGKPTAFLMDNFYYYLNLKDARGWIGTVAIPYKYLKSIEAPQHFRDIKDSLPRTKTSLGYHFSWLGGPEAIDRKFKSCIEPMDKSRLPSIEQIKGLFDDMSSKGQYHFMHAEDPTNPRVPLTLVPHQTIITDDMYPMVKDHILHSYGFPKTNN